MITGSPERGGCSWQQRSTTAGRNSTVIAVIYEATRRNHFNPRLAGGGMGVLNSAFRGSGKTVAPVPHIHSNCRVKK